MIGKGISVVFKEGRLFGDKIFLDGRQYKATVGKHAIWIPEIEAKIIWTYHGEIEAYRDWDKGRNAKPIKEGNFGIKYALIANKKFTEQAVHSIWNEYTLMSIMAEHKMTPDIGDLFYIANFVCEYPFGVKACDPLGKYGYFIKDAAELEEPGEFNMQNFDKHILPLLSKSPSKGAYGDIGNPKNIVNGYCIDVRRTIWDMIDLVTTQENHATFEKSITYRETKKQIREAVKEFGQFPYGKRKLSYQSYMLGGSYEEGSRDTEYRMKQMGLDSKYAFVDKSVLDIGCCYGAICFDAYSKGARKVSGFDNQKEYIKIARRIANYNAMPINFVSMDIVTDNAAKWVNTYYPEGVDVVFALSLYSHVKDKLFELLKNFKWNECYIESNNVPEGKDSQQAKSIESGFKKYGLNFEFIGMTEDRSPRCLWKLIK